MLSPLGNLGSRLRPQYRLAHISRLMNRVVTYRGFMGSDRIHLPKEFAADNSKNQRTSRLVGP
jgi:hypothetical protein